MRLAQDITIHLFWINHNFECTMIIVIKIKVMKNYVDSKKAKYRDGAPYGDAGIKRKQNKTFI